MSLITINESEFTITFTCSPTNEWVAECEHDLITYENKSVNFSPVPNKEHQVRTLLSLPKQVQMNENAITIQIYVELFDEDVLITLSKKDESDIEHLKNKVREQRHYIQELEEKTDTNRITRYEKSIQQLEKQISHLRTTLYDTTRNGLNQQLDYIYNNPIRNKQSDGEFITFQLEQTQGGSWFIQSQDAGNTYIKNIVVPNATYSNGYNSHPSYNFPEKCVGDILNTIQRKCSIEVLRIRWERLNYHRRLTVYTRKSNYIKRFYGYGALYYNINTFKNRRVDGELVVYINYNYGVSTECVSFPYVYEK